MAQQTRFIRKVKQSKVEQSKIKPGNHHGFHFVNAASCAVQAVFVAVSVVLAALGKASAALARLSRRETDARQKTHLLDRNRLE
ncbi:MAG: hypothetical protein H7X91_03225 [Burkholderiales bacterium]|nr:hypothetical protein [Burkholderiales bacterium]